MSVCAYMCAYVYVSLCLFKCVLIYVCICTYRENTGLEDTNNSPYCPEGHNSLQMGLSSLTVFFFFFPGSLGLVRDSDISLQVFKY